MLIFVIMMMITTKIRELSFVDETITKTKSADYKKKHWKEDLILITAETHIKNWQTTEC